MAHAPRIILADCDHAMRAFLRAGLERDGNEVVEAEHGLALLREVTQPDGHFDLVVADVRMPVLSGLEVLAMTREALRPPFVMITGMVDPATMPLALELGAAAVLTKPFEVRELRLLVATLVGRTRH